MAKNGKLQTLGTTLGKYFTAKQKYWYVVALNRNVDSDILVDGALRCVEVSMNLRAIVSYVETYNNMMMKKGLVFTVIKTPLYVPKGTQVHIEKAQAIVSTKSPLWPSLTSYVKGPFDASGLNDHELDTIKIFASNETK